MSFYWRVFAGASLESTSEDPIELLFDRSTYDRLNALEPAAWKLLLSLLDTEQRERR